MVRAGLRRSAGRRRREAAGDAIHADASPWHGATCCTLPARAIDWFPVRAKGSSPRQAMYAQTRRQTTLLTPPRPTDSFSSPLVRSRQGQDCAAASYPAPTTHSFRLQVVVGGRFRYRPALLLARSRCLMLCFLEEKKRFLVM